MPRLSLTALLGITLAISLASPIELGAQTRALPKAQFQTYTQSGNSSLPGVNGLHLTPGESRGNNQPATFYPPGEPTLNGALVRWEAKKMPLKIWISPGIKLPDCPVDQIQEVRVEQVNDMLFHSPSPDPWVGLSKAYLWTPETNFLVANGIEQWRRFQNEGLISFGFTDDPREAQILVFFTDGFSESGPGGTHVAGMTSAQIYPFELAQRVNIKQKPVVIELLLDGNEERLQAQAAHEFGHALGIKAHSPYREDLMFVDRLVPNLSPADVATLRYLYKRQPQYVL